jgi:hypothetical protein
MVSAQTNPCKTSEFLGSDIRRRLRGHGPEIGAGPSNIIHLLGSAAFCPAAPWAGPLICAMALNSSHPIRGPPSYAQELFRIPQNGHSEIAVVESLLARSRALQGCEQNERHGGSSEAHRLDLRSGGVYTLSTLSWGFDDYPCSHHAMPRHSHAPIFHPAWQAFSFPFLSAGYWALPS